MIMNLQSYEENQICLALFHGTGENYNLALLNTEQDILSTKWTLQTLLIYSQLQKPGKDCRKCFYKCNFVFRSHLYLYQKFFCSQFSLKNTPFSNFCDFCIFKSHMNTKQRFQVGPGAPTFSGALGPMWS